MPSPLEKARKNKRLSKTKLAKLAGLSRQTVVDIVSGKVSPRDLSLAKLCVVLDLEIRDLFIEENA